MSEASLFSRNLPLGRCQYFHGRAKIKRASTFDSGHENPSTQVHLVSSGVTVYVCKSRETNPGPNCSIDGTDTILGWNQAVKLVASTSDGVLVFVQSLIKHKKVSPTFAFSPAHSCQNWARLLPVQESRNLRSNFVATMSHLPIVPLSVVFRRRPNVPYKRDDVLQPLQLSSLKRQMAGLYILYCHEVVTTEISMTLADASYHMFVESIYCPQGSQSEVGVFLLTPNTRITVLEVENKISGESNYADCSSPNQSDTTGMLLRTLRSIHLAVHADVPRMFLLSGPAGVGKTHSVRCAIQGFQGPIHAKFLRGSDIVASMDGSVSPALCLEKHFIQLQSRSIQCICLLFLDECDALMTSPAAVAIIGQQLDQIALSWRKIVVVAATNRIDSVPQSLRRSGRLEHELILQPPSVHERNVILRSLIGKDAPPIEEIAEMTIGFVAADLNALVRKSRVLSLNSTCSLASNLRKAMDSVGASAFRDASLSSAPKATWNSIAGNAGGAKTTLLQAIEWPSTKKQAFQRLGLAPPRGILLHGPPGCAKTTLANAAAGSKNIAFLSLSPADVYASSYMGEAEAIVRRAFATARAAAPCILFFDEIDSIVGSGNGGYDHQMNRSGGGASPESRVLSTFLNETDGLTSNGGDNVMVMGATNRPCTLDAALLRPGRFDKVIYVPKPDFDGRVAILEKHLRQLTRTENCLAFDIHRLASDDITGKLTGAEMIGAIREFVFDSLQASLGAGTRHDPTIREEDLEHALRAVKPLLSTPGILAEYEEFENRRIISRS